MSSKKGRQAENSKANAALVEVLWHDVILCCRQLHDRGSFRVGHRIAGSGEPVDFTVPDEALPSGAPALVTLTDRGVAVGLIAGAQGTLQLDGGEPLELSADHAGELLRALPAGAVVRQRLGELTLRVTALRRERPLSRLQWSRTKRWLAACVGLSALAHIAVGGTSYLLQPEPWEIDDDSLTEDQRALIQHYLAVAADWEEIEEIAREEEATEHAEGGTGTRAKGEEGSMGSRSNNNSRYGVSGQAMAQAQAASLRDAAEFGMIGLLSSGAGGDPDAPSAPWGADARPGGLNLSGFGQGGGGKGSGVGLGSIGTIGQGAGTGTGQGFGNGHGRLGGPHHPPAAGFNQGFGSPGPYQSGSPLPLSALPSIDPNGRFATTYRPGRGHLAAFESAVARGLIPPATRELVSDVGAAYAPELELHSDRALTPAAHFERAALPPSGGVTHLRLALRSAPESPKGRPPLSVHLVLDVSGSMEGESLSYAKQAAQQLLERLLPTDVFSLVTFSNDASVVVPGGPLGGRLPTIRQTIEKLHTEGGTNLHSGLSAGYAQASKGQAGSDAVKVVLLLSDGRANQGVTHPESLSRMALSAFQDAVQTSTFGLGRDYDGALMSALASNGAGGYYYLRSAEHISQALSTEVRQRLDPAATAVEIRVRLQDDVRLLHVYGSHKLSDEEGTKVRLQEVATDQQAAKRDGIAQDRQQDQKGGMRFFIPAFSRDDQYSLLLKLAVPAGVDKRRIGVMELRYKDRLHGRNVMNELPLAVAYAQSDAASAATTDASVIRTVQGHLAGEDLLQAATRVSFGDLDGARKLVSEREQILRQAAGSLAETGFERDADRFARLRSHLDGPHEPQALAMLFEAAGRTRLR